MGEGVPQWWESGSGCLGGVPFLCPVCCHVSPQVCTYCSEWLCLAAPAVSRLCISWEAACVGIVAGLKLCGSVLNYALPDWVWFLCWALSAASCQFLVATPGFVPSCLANLTSSIPLFSTCASVLACLSVCGPGWILMGWKMGRRASWTRQNHGAGP